MTGAHDGGKGTARHRLALTASAVILVAIGLYIYLSPQQFGARSRVVRFAHAMGRLVGWESRATKPLGVIIRDIVQGDEVKKTQTILLLRYDLSPAEMPGVFPYLISAMKDQSESVRNAAATIVGDLSHHFSGEARAAEEALTVLLDDSSPALRARAVQSLRGVAMSGNLDAPPARLVACLDDDSAPVRIGAIEALIEYRQGPELIVPAALRRIPTEAPDVSAAFEDLFWHVRLQPSVLPLLTEGLSTEDTGVRRCCTAAINHMGRDARPALAAVMTLLRTELGMGQPPNSDASIRHPMIVGMAAGAIGELTPDTDAPPGSVELLGEVIKRADKERRSPGPNHSNSPLPSAKAKALNPGSEFVMAEAVWSLGIFGRSAAAAVPLLLATFESARNTSDHLAGLTAESMAAITRSTPDEARVLATLAKAWRTAPPEQKTGIARALRTLGPKSEQLVPELRQMPRDGMGSQIRPVRYPRSRRGSPVRE